MKWPRSQAMSRTGAAGSIQPLEVRRDFRPDPALLALDASSESASGTVSSRRGLGPPGLELGPDPGDDLVEHLVEGRRGLEAEHSRALRTSGTRICTSCSNGGSET